jgi:hypothetical protein
MDSALLLNTAQAAQLLGISPRTLEGWRRKGAGRLLGLDAPVKNAVTDSDGRPLIGMVMLRDVLLQLDQVKDAGPAEVIEVQGARVEEDDEGNDQ